MQANNNNNQILDFIRLDNEAEFSKAIQTNKNKCLSFGRFPILSLCYIYAAKKIIKKHEKRLLRIDEYNKIELEPLDAYSVIKDNSGTLLRQIQHLEIICPLVVLAILDKAGKIQKIISSANSPTADALDITGTQKDLIIKIFKSKRGSASFDESSSLITPRKKLKRLHKILLSAAALALALIIATPITTVHLINQRGHGTHDSPFRIRTADELIAASHQQNTYFILRSDITLPFGFSIDYFLPTLNGNNHTINSPQGIPIAHTLKGTIKNLNFTSIRATPIIYHNYNTGLLQNITHNIANANDPAARTITQATGMAHEEDIGRLGLVVKINDGTISSLVANIYADITATFSSHYYESYIGGIVAQNRGTINNSVLNGHINFRSDGIGEVFFGGIAGRNMGTIRDNSRVTGAISVYNASVGGIVGLNDGIGDIFDSIMSGQLELKINNSFYALYAGGVAAFSAGGWDRQSKIVGNRVLGNIRVYDMEESNRHGVFVGGVAGFSGGLADMGGGIVFVPREGVLIENNIVSGVVWANTGLDDAVIVAGLIGLTNSIRNGRDGDKLFLLAQMRGNIYGGTNDALMAALVTRYVVDGYLIAVPDGYYLRTVLIAQVLLVSSIWGLLD